MDSRLEDKLAFFERLGAYRHIDDDDALDSEEERSRQKSRSFHAAKSSSRPTTSSRATISEARQLPDATSKRAALNPASKSHDREIEIIAATPENSTPKRKGPKPLPSASVGHDVIVPDTVVAAAKQPQRRITRSSAHVRHLSPQSDPSPSVKTGKRKKDAPLQLVPEARQIFKGLCFYYIPNDDIDPVRKLRITKARQHGTTWVRNLVDATHIIVDKKLAFADIERCLGKDPKWSGKVLVHENYPIDCISHRIIANPDQNQYKISGVPTLENSPPSQTSSLHNSESSLQLKLRRKKVLKGSRAPLPSTQSSGGSPSQECIYVIPSSQPQEAQSILDDVPSSEAKKSLRKQSPEIIDNDELTQCINETKGIDGGLAEPSSIADDFDAFTDLGSSEEERPQKRRTRSNRNDSVQRKPSWQDNFACMKGGTKDHEDNGPNAETIKVLQEMLEVHNLAGDNFRIRAYRLAISTLREQPKKICTAEEARALPHIGRIADKIEEIVNTNRLRQLEYALDDPRRKTMGMFLKIYGVGQTQAQKWIAQGFQTLDDLRNKAELNASQRIGLDHFDDINTRIPRQEVEALADHVKKTAALIDRRIELIVGGSYRRGADSSGDIDLIITKKRTSSTAELTPFLNRLVEVLTREGFLTAALATHHYNSDDIEGSSKWHGCCVLPKSAFPGPEAEYRPTWRRIDFLIAPQAELGAALLYFTGNDIFNRSMRLLARKKGMRLNQRGLFRDVLQDRGSTAKKTAGTLLEGRDEKKIFEILGVRWREPHERWCG